MYKGNNLPAKYPDERTPIYYLGSSSVRNIMNGYMGSPSSKLYKEVWKKETRESSDQFQMFILHRFSTRNDALKDELRIQEFNNVVKNPLFVNLSLARPNGFHGMNNKGELNSGFGKDYPSTWSDEKYQRRYPSSQKKRCPQI
jgi:hypothetical protein